MRGALAAVALLAAACATVPKQTAFMQRSGVEVTSDALRSRLRAEAVPFTGRVAQSADAARAASSDPAVRRRLLLWKIDVVPALYRSIFDQRPMVALLDTWSLILQAEDYLQGPAGRGAFGPGAEQMRVTFVDLEARVRAIAAWAAPGKDLDRTRSRLARWASEHPVGDGFAARESVEQLLVTRAPGEDLDVFAVAGRIDDSLEGLVERIDFLPVMVPNQAMWKAELTYLDLVDPRLEAALVRGGEALARIDAVVEWLGTAGLDGFAEEQRDALLRAVRGERAAVEAIIDRQRQELQAFAERERVALAAMIAEERKATAADVQRLVEHASAEASRGAEKVVDHLVARLALLFGGTLAAAGAIAWGLRRRRAS